MFTLKVEKIIRAWGDLVETLIVIGLIDYSYYSSLVASLVVKNLATLAGLRSHECLKQSVSEFDNDDE